MTAVFSRSAARRAAAALGAVSMGLVALSACEKPTPMATLTAGTESVSSEAEADCYDDGRKLSSKKLSGCVGQKSAPSDKTLTVSPGERLRVGVEPEIAETGWALVVNGRGAMTEASTDTYRSFDHDEIFAPQQSGDQPGAASIPKSARVTVVEVDKAGDAKGTWSFRVKRSS